jgi:uncharacterized membrane protein HdeD (DUF308 family)
VAADKVRGNPAYGRLGTHRVIHANGNGTMSTCGFLMVFAGLIFALGCLMSAPWFHLAVPISLLGVAIAAVGLAMLLGRERRGSPRAKITS